MNIKIFRERIKQNKKIFFVLFIALESILIGILVMRALGPDSLSPRALSKKEIEYYNQYSVSLPNVAGDDPCAAEVLAHCVYQEYKIIGGELYTLYTSDTLSHFLYRCNNILEISGYQGIVYITYTSLDADEVTLTIGDRGVVQKSIYSEETDTFYALSKSENYKYIHFRDQRSGYPIVETLAIIVGLGLALSFVIYEIERQKKYCY